jgi:hypothetical protein
MQGLTGSFSLLSPIQRLFHSFVNFYVLLIAFRNLKVRTFPGID